MNQTTQHLTVLLLTLLMTAGLAAATPRLAHADPERERVELLLNAYDAPASADQLGAAASNPRAVLIQIAQDPAVPEYRRFAALQALALFPNEQVRALYSAILREIPGRAEGPRIAHPTIQAMMKAFGESALIEVEPLLGSKDVQVRLTAVHAIARFGGDKGRSLLRAHAEREPNRIVLEELERLVAELH